MYRHDPLAYLPQTPLQEFPQEATIPSNRLYLLLSGRLKIYRSDGSGPPVLVRLVSDGQFFGEECLLGEGQPLGQTAVTMEWVKVAAWSPEQVEHSIGIHPDLGLALLEHCVATNIILEERLAARAKLSNRNRVALALVQVSETFGDRVAQGIFEIQGVTHRLIAEFVGTTREVVTKELNRLRNERLVRYSHKHLVLDRDALIHQLAKECRFRPALLHTPPVPAPDWMTLVVPPSVRARAALAV